MREVMKVAWGAFVLGLVVACNGRADLGAYLHQTTASAEPPANAQSAAPSPTPSTTKPSPVAIDSAASGAAAPMPAPSKPVSLGSEAEHSRSKVRPTAQTDQTASTAPLAAPLAAPSLVPAPLTPGQRNASIGGASVSGGNISNAARVVAGLRSGIRECFRSDAASGPGSVRFTLSVGANGAVTRVSTAPSGSVSGGVLACATARVRAARFDAPEGGSAVIAFPVNFTIS